MPRMQPTEYAERKLGVIKARITDLALIDPATNKAVGIPPFMLKDEPSALLHFKVLPETHDREQNFYVPIKIVMDKENTLSLRLSKGVNTINKMVIALTAITGTDPKGNAGFGPSGAFLNEKDQPIATASDLSPMADWLAKQLLEAGDKYQIYVHVFKKLSKNGNKYYNTGTFFNDVDAKGMKSAINSAVSDVKYHKLTKLDTNAEQLAAAMAVAQVDFAPDVVDAPLPEAPTSFGDFDNQF